MIKIRYSERFLRAARKLPSPQQKKLASLLETLQEDPFHPQLHTKPLVGELSGLYAFRITRDWRVIFQFLNEKTIHLIEVGHRKDIYR